MDTAPNEAFFDTLPVFEEFEGVADGDNYRPLPDGWALASADIVGSTKAIASGRYKAVNMAGASVISAILNSVGRRDLPFVFGGDGAFVAIPGSAIEQTRQALAAVKTWVSGGIAARAARRDRADGRHSRAQGLDVRVARFQASSEIAYAMFTGGGASWAEAQMKAGHYAVAAAPAGTRPDLTGLSCRWNPIEAHHGEIVSIIAIPGGAGTDAAFQQLVSDIVALAAEQERGGHPVPAAGPDYRLSAARHGLRGARRRAEGQAAAGQAQASSSRRSWRWLFDRLEPAARRLRPDALQERRGAQFGFPQVRRWPEDDHRRRRRALLTRSRPGWRGSRRPGICRYGLHRQSSALMTCIVPSPMTRDHMHFIDGAAGGYAMAAQQSQGKIRQLIFGSRPTPNAAS